MILLPPVFTIQGIFWASFWLFGRADLSGQDRHLGNTLYFPRGDKVHDNMHTQIWRVSLIIYI